MNFEDWRQARAGDFMEDFLRTARIGREESGHLTVLVKDGGDEVTFWSSNVPDGYGSRAVPKSRIRRVIFTRITRPERFNLAPSVGQPRVAGLPAAAGRGHEGRCAGTAACRSP